MDSCVRRLAQLTFHSHEDQELKRHLLLPFASVLLLAVFFAVLRAATDVFDLALIGYTVGSGIGAVTFFRIVFERRSIASIVGPCIAVATVAVCCIDFRQKQLLLQRSWTLAIALLDVGLIARVSGSVLNAIVAFAVVYVVFASVNDEIGLSLREQALFGHEHPVAVCDCAAPPCSKGAEAPLQVMLPIIVFVVDFCFTRNFAGGMRKQMASVVAAVRVAEGVTALLSQYRTEESRQLVDAAVDIPKELSLSLRQLIRNLDTYRAYLPQSCLPADGANMTPSSSVADMPRLRSNSGLLSSAASTEHTSAATVSRHSSMRPSRRPDDEITASESFGTPAEHRHDTPETPRTPGSCAAPAGRLGAVSSAPRVATVTLLCLNRVNFMKFLEQTPVPELTEWFRTEVGRFSQAVTREGGVVDILSADHFFASFGAARGCPTHRTAAVRTASQFTTVTACPGSPRCTVVLKAGAVICGDFGTCTLKRFMSLGEPAHALMLMDRLAVKFGVAEVLCDSAVRRDAEVTWECRLRQIVQTTRTCSPLFLYDVVRPKSMDSSAEWMYELDKAVNPWDAVNMAHLRWHVAGREAARAQLELSCASGCSAEVDEWIACLKRQMSERKHAALRVVDLSVEKTEDGELR